MPLNRSNFKNFPLAAPIGTAGDIFIHILLPLIAFYYLEFISPSKKIENFSIILSKKRKFFNFLPAKVPLMLIDLFGAPPVIKSWRRAWLYQKWTKRVILSFMIDIYLSNVIIFIKCLSSASLKRGESIDIDKISRISAKIACYSVKLILYCVLCYPVLAPLCIVQVSCGSLPSQLFH